MRIIGRDTLVNRCKSAGFTGIYKSYIRDIQLIDRRKGADWFMEERDFSFTHKGKKYIIRAEIEGDKRYSALFKYTVEEVQ